MHPSPTSPNRGKEAAWAQKKQETVQCKYTDRHRQAEPYIETVWPTEKKLYVNCNTNWNPNLWEVDGQAAEWWSVLQLAKLRGVSICDSSIYDRQTDRQTNIQTDRRSSSRFSAYLFFQRACQTVEKQLMQTEKVSECFSHFCQRSVCFHFVSMDRVNFRVYNSHTVTREAWR